MNHKNDQFYIDMQSVKNNSLPVQNYISSKFANFWSSFYTYLAYFQKQINQSRFSKGPKGYLTICFEGVSKILEKASVDIYDESMKPDMTNCFKSMLHPDNVDFIKQAALDFFIIIYPRLKKTGINYTEDFEQYFFDFSFADSSLKISSIDNEMRLQVQDQEPPKTFNSKFDSFLNTINNSFVANPNEDDIQSWWTFIQKNILVVIFYSILKNKPQIQGVSEISNFPQETERIFINFLNCIIQNGFLKNILQIENSPDYIVDILCYLSQESMISKINSLEFINSFMKVLIDTQVNIIRILYEKNYHLLLELMSVITNCLNFSFSSDNKLVPELTKIFTTYFNFIFKLFNDDYKYELCSHLSHCEKITNVSCLLHYLTLLFCLFVNNRIMDKKLWDTIVNSDGLFDLNLVLSCFAHFAGYYSTYVFHILLGLEVNELFKSFASAAKLSQYLDLTDQIWSKEFGDAFNMEYQKMFLNLRQQLIHSLVLNSPGITSIKMIDLFPNEQRHFPQKEEILKLLRVMFSSFVWQDKKYESDELNQFYCYLVNASFITPLLKIANVVSPDVVFNRNFLIEEFLTFLKNCIKSSGSNLLIKLHSLATLGNIICQKESLTALDENSLADWYLTLHDLIINGGDNKDDDDELKGDLKMKIKLSALTFSCRSIILGFKGSSILLKTIADNFDLINQIDQKLISSGSSTGLNSYLSKEGFEMLTSSDTASLLISLSNFCEFSNIFSFNCYNSGEAEKENDDEKSVREKKDELKLKLIQNCIDTIDASLRATVVTSLLSEEAEANRCSESILNKLLEILFQYFKDSSPEKVYAATTITLVLPELEKVKKGSVELILDEAIGALENRKIENDRDELLFGRFAEFVADLLIYSSFIISTQKQLKHFQKVAESWNLDNLKSEDDQNAIKKFNDQTKQRLLYAVMSLTSHYLRFPPPTPSFSPTDEEDTIDKLSFSADSVSGLQAASFGSSNDCVIRICDNEIASLLPVGQFTWNFRSVAPEPERRIVSDDVSIGDQMQSVSDQKEQVEFTSRLVNFVDDLYANHFTEINDKASENEKADENENQISSETKDANNDDDDVGAGQSDLENFEVFRCHLYNPSDFDSSSSPSLDSPSVDDIKLRDERLPPHTVGPRSAAFLSSLNFFDSQMTTRFFPSIQTYRCVEVSEFRHVIHVGFINLKATENDSHFIDFKAGLGLLDENKESIIFADSRHQIVFHVKEEGIKAHPDIFVCWNENEPTEDWVNTFDGSKQKLRIEIKPTHSGLFNVSVLVNKNYHQSDLKCLSNVLVSKNNLPNFVIGQIIVNVHILDFKNNKIARLQLQNGIEIREKREKEFTPYCLLMNCEKTLLTKANSNNFDGDDDDDDEK